MGDGDMEGGMFSESESEDEGCARRRQETETEMKLLEGLTSTSGARGVGRGLSKNEQKDQRYHFRSVMETAETGDMTPIDISIGTKSASVSLENWRAYVRYNFMKKYLRGGVLQHIQQNDTVSGILFDGDF
eukprot:GDKI01001540.1.p1 GENE.GDKI01001540.1~~GDKI01001540.1.p1  ORF type:complete len:141 (-),score=42.05 GDKI01001540.1:9-401(-)